MKAALRLNALGLVFWRRGCEVRARVATAQSGKRAPLALTHNHPILARPAAGLLFGYSWMHCTPAPVTANARCDTGRRQEAAQVSGGTAAGTCHKTKTNGGDRTHKLIEQGTDPALFL
jgi:hypothetical protein